MSVRKVMRGLVGVVIAVSVLGLMAGPGWAIEVVHKERSGRVKSAHP